MQISATEFDGLPDELKALFVKLPNPGSDEVMEAFAAFGESKSRGGVRNNHNQGHDGWSGTFRTGPLNSPHEDSGSAARFFYCAKAPQAERAGSKHPTVKPIALIRWLVRLVTPPNGTVLDPFAGSGTTAAAAIAENRNAIMIEREPEYVADIRRRVATAAAAAKRKVTAPGVARHSALPQGEVRCR
jgi:site-specific DNA-methyltransferase (adenine-specific)